jgi:hypothetical protein
VKVINVNIQIKTVQVCINSGHQVAVTTKYFKVAPSICVSSVWNLLHVTLLAARILRWLIDFGIFCTPANSQLHFVKKLTGDIYENESS